MSTSPSPWRRAVLGAALLLSLLAAAGCGSVPADPDGTLERIEATGVLRAGASPSGGLVIVDGARPTGTLVTLVEGFAAEHRADVRWTVASEEDLVAGLEAGRLDVVVGGMTTDTPWSSQASVTRGYPGIPGSEGAQVALLLPLGENALQAALETYLDGEVRS